MKKLSSVLMGAAFILAICGAWGTKAYSSPKFATQLTGVLNQPCTTITSSCGSGTVTCSQPNIYAFNTDHKCLILLTKQP